MRITILGSGTSTGVPLIACTCPICLSNDPHNKRYRSSVLVEMEDSTSIVIDTTPDFRTQALRAKITKVDAVLYSHAHADHILGMDDLRAFNFVTQQPIPIYASAESCDDIRKIFAYAFEELINYQGGTPPKLILNTVEPNKPIRIKGHTIIPLLVFHGTLQVLGFRINNFAYITDCSHIPDETMSKLHNLDCLVLDGLRERPHNTHFTLFQAVEIMKLVTPKKGYITHISHEIDHDEGNKLIHNLTAQNVELAFDELIIDIP